ncbi:MAG: CHASE2 domain-containing protein [Spirochaetaceae bacterium]|nr:CHASE2 domain-containing protein [Spirochaetaceae bacterium]
MKKILITLSITFLSALLFTGFIFNDFYRGLDSKLYDLALFIRPEIEEDERLLIIDIDDPTIAKINMYPLSRDIFAEGMILMKEFDPYWSLLDIEFIDRSPAGINLSILNNSIPEEFNYTFSDIKQNSEGLFQSITEQWITLEEAKTYVEELSGLIDQEKTALLSEVQKVARDNDKYLGEAIGYFGNVTSTINMIDEKDLTTTDEHRKYGIENFSLNRKLVIDSNGKDPFHIAQEMKPAIMEVLSRSKTAGFPRVERDSDGVMRRVDLVYNHDGNYYGQLGFMTFWNMMGRPSMETDGRILKLKGKEMTIPLTRDGRMLINWPNKSYIDSFRHLPFYVLYEHDRLIESLFYNLKLMDQYDFLRYPYYEGEISILEYYKELQDIQAQFIAAGDGSSVKAYREARDYLFDQIDLLLNGDSEELIRREIDGYSQYPDLTGEELLIIEDMKKLVDEFYPESRSLLEDILKIRAYLDEELKGSISIIGYSGSSTTDIGVNPFEKEYMNVGLYAAVLNTLFQQDFLYDAPWWISGILAFCLAFISGFIVIRMKPGTGVIIGIIFTLLSFVIPGIIFYFRGIYVYMLPTILTTVTVFLSAVIINFFKESKEKGFIRGAFSHYLSVDVISELIDDPSRLALGGEERELTAIFTDIKGFSTISEKLTPGELVSLLNTYLTAMSDIIMAEKGTIDKYEGDAIISFFGAPVNIEDHAVKACIAALKMRDEELKLSRELLDKGKTPMPLLTRFGINTGPMVVGNMGTSQKMDYTIMGSDVNLASRLEGVNKQYGTQILISGATKKKIGEEFVTRELDKVRVVGINRPVTIHELCCFRKNLSENQREGYQVYTEALNHFRSKKWAFAEEHFKQVLTFLPEDGPSKVFIKRCRQYNKKAPSADWDGVYNLVKK